MAGTSRFWKMIVLGALAGGAISLFKRETRTAVFDSAKKTSDNLVYALKNPGEITDTIRDAAKKIQHTVEQMNDDIVYIAGKVEELRDTTPQLVGILKDTKGAFAKKEEGEGPETVSAMAGGISGEDGKDPILSEVILKEADTVGT
ncbi:YtxH domain-containing protein [Neobacillus notoginsengisoli]|uniref:YtxH domain-containing protein n=1 Tax=Neobacillus notoginsengisoli TaxID=1578198 RepID=A0A417YVY2_9BACI|nr:YtxH domain-containing protein [Neobacillus notoginsengisoli]RHW41559.1 YtxH domain-containing protein [Neobacillus notoginsengisoli]